MPPTPSGPLSTGLTITNPLILYRTLLATKRIDPDPAQHRLALELQKIYFRLKDYSPEVEYGARLKSISRAVQIVPKHLEKRDVAVPGHPLRRNPLFSHLFRKIEDQNILALTRVLTSHEAAMNLNSPRGLLLHGEVGTGKSMLVDLLADSLPTSKKRRWHFNTFMLETLSRLEHLRTSRSGGDSEYSLIWLAKEMIEKSPILFLDEFQLPDRAASKILSNLLTPFFQLGGVLIASSNRMPDELAKASGMDFTAPPRGGLVRNLLGFGGGNNNNTFPTNNEYSQFVEVLKSRCDIWDMEGRRDWRRREAEGIDDEASELAETMREEMFGGSAGLEKMEPGNIGLGYEQSRHDRMQEADLTKLKSLTRGSIFFLPQIMRRLGTLLSAQHFLLKQQVQFLEIYGPASLWQIWVTYWTFNELCRESFGPADYVTLASTFHTLILDEVPVLTLSQKNEARRLITLLDALYESRCKLIMRAEVGPDELFFPEIKEAVQSMDGAERSRAENDSGDAVYPETLSEIYQDQTSPFRPNVSTYTNEPKAGYDPDEDSDFGLIPGKGNEIERTVDFGMTSTFTGEDERFAYKRARSRLWEMCGARWHERSDEGWWRPLSPDVRRWELSSPVTPLKRNTLASRNGDVKVGASVELDRPAGLQGKELEEKEKHRESPFHKRREERPRIG